MSTNGNPSASLIALVGVVGVILVFVVIVGLQTLFYNVQKAEIEEKVYSQIPEELSRLRSQQLEQLNRYRWIDEKGGVVGVPIDRAMDLVVKELQDSAPVMESQPSGAP